MEISVVVEGSKGDANPSQVFPATPRFLKVGHGGVASEKWQEYLWGWILVISVASRESL